MVTVLLSWVYIFFITQCIGVGGVLDSWQTFKSAGIKMLFLKEYCVRDCVYNRLCTVFQPVL